MITAVCVRARAHSSSQYAKTYILQLLTKFLNLTEVHCISQNVLFYQKHLVKDVDGSRIIQKLNFLSVQNGCLFHTGTISLIYGYRLHI
jgi:hypothetical protein